LQNIWRIIWVGLIIQIDPVICVMSQKWSCTKNLCYNIRVVKKSDLEVEFFHDFFHASLGR